jgi:serine protease Do
MIRIFLLSLLILLALSSCVQQQDRVILKNLTSHELDIRSAKKVVAFKSFVKGRTYGTGFHVSYLGKTFILTNKHVCDAGLRIDKSKTLRVNNRIVKVLKIDTEHDLCAVEAIMDSGLSLAQKEPSPLDQITLIGHPRGLPTVIRKGAIINHGEPVCIYYYNGLRCLEATRISATAYPGNSGSPVLNAFGNIVGVLFAGQNRYPHEPLIVPYSFVQRFILKVIQLQK